MYLSIQFIACCLILPDVRSPLAFSRWLVCFYFSHHCLLCFVNIRKWCTSEDFSCCVKLPCILVQSLQICKGEFRYLISSRDYDNDIRNCYKTRQSSRCDTEGLYYYIEIRFVGDYLFWGLVISSLLIGWSWSILKKPNHVFGFGILTGIQLSQERIHCIVFTLSEMTPKLFREALNTYQKIVLSSHNKWMQRYVWFVAASWIRDLCEISLESLILWFGMCRPWNLFNMQSWLQ